MKRYLFYLCIINFLFSGCSDKNELITFNEDTSYVYFAYPSPVYRDKEKFLDSINYNFSLDEQLAITEKKIAIPVRCGGISADKPRTYDVQIASESSYSPELITISSPIIGAGKYVDTLYLTIRRGVELTQEKQTLVLTLRDNEEFRVGHNYNRSIKINFSDMLTEPTWWNTWRTAFGPFYKEVLQQWMQIYYLGADPSPHLTEGTPGPVYYWNNMPSSATQSWYPVTYMYIGTLKKYFDENIVYPNGDTTKERILLP